MNDLEYKYIFEIDNIKQSLYLCLVHSANLSNYNLSKLDCHRIKNYTKDFKSISKKLIKTKNIDNIDEYINALNSLIIINARIKKIFQDNAYSKDKKIRKLNDDCVKIDKLLGAESSFQLFIDNHQTACLFITLILVLIVICVIPILVFKNATVSIIGIIAFLIILLVVAHYLDTFELLKDRDKNRRVLSNYTYIKSAKMRKIHTATEQIILSATKNIK